MKIKQIWEWLFRGLKVSLVLFGVALISFVIRFVLLLISQSQPSAILAVILMLVSLLIGFIIIGWVFGMKKVGRFIK